MVRDAADEIQASSGLRRFYYQRLQFWLFPLALAANNFSIQRAGWAHLIRMLRHSKGQKAAHWIDLGALVMHYAIWIGVPLFFWPMPAVAAFYILRTTLLGYAMYAILAPGHFPAEAQRTTDEARHGADFFAVQTAGTVSFRTGSLGRFLCSGLEYQVEHHLFPNISHVHYPEISVAVQEFCADAGAFLSLLQLGHGFVEELEGAAIPASSSKEFGSGSRLTPTLTKWGRSATCHRRRPG